MKYRLTGTARMLNWLLAASLAASCIAGVVMLRGNPAFAAFVGALAALLLVGVLLRWPVAYIAIATLSFFGAAAALRRPDFLIGVINLLAMIAALFVRSRLARVDSLPA